MLIQFGVPVSYEAMEKLLTSLTFMSNHIFQSHNLGGSIRLIEWIVLWNSHFDILKNHTLLLCSFSFWLQKYLVYCHRLFWVTEQIKLEVSLSVFFWKPDCWVQIAKVAGRHSSCGSGDREITFRMCGSVSLYCTVFIVQLLPSFWRREALSWTEKSTWVL